MNTQEIRKIFTEACVETTEGFLGVPGKISAPDKILSSDEIHGVAINVSGNSLQYFYMLHFASEDNEKYLDLLLKTYPFIEESDLTEIDLKDFLGEFLNIMSGKINKALEKADPSLKIGMPYFAMEFEGPTDESPVSFRCEFADLNFDIYYTVKN